MVGRFIGEDALAAVGTTYSLNFLTLGFVQGTCVGFGIPLAQSKGAKDGVEFKRYFWNGVWLCGILGAVMTVLTFLFAQPLLRLINTPEDILMDATRYIQVIFLGKPATILYNYCAGALRSAGDSQRPTYFLLATSLLNILLDYVFIVPIPMESVGMGMATYAGQNDGAKRYDRIKEGIRAGLTIQLSYCVAAWLVIFFGKDVFTQIVLGPNAGEAAALSVQYLGIISTLFCIHGSLMIMRNTLQGMGYSLHAVLSGAGELLGRALGGWLAVNYFGFVGICFANPFAWGFALVYCSILVFHFLRKRMHQTKK